jgi:hypothetical protein
MHSQKEAVNVAIASMGSSNVDLFPPNKTVEELQEQYFGYVKQVATLTGNNRFVFSLCVHS